MQERGRARVRRGRPTETLGEGEAKGKQERVRSRCGKIVRQGRKGRRKEWNRWEVRWRFGGIEMG